MRHRYFMRRPSVQRTLPHPRSYDRFIHEVPLASLPHPSHPYLHPLPSHRIFRFHFVWHPIMCPNCNPALPRHVSVLCPACAVPSDVRLGADTRQRQQQLAAEVAARQQEVAAAEAAEAAAAQALEALRRQRQGLVAREREVKRQAVRSGFVAGTVMYCLQLGVRTGGQEEEVVRRRAGKGAQPSEAGSELGQRDAGRHVHQMLL